MLRMETFLECNLVKDMKDMNAHNYREYIMSPITMNILQNMQNTLKISFWKCVYHVNEPTNM